MRLAGSSGANPFACIAAGIAALWGPAHGGANEAITRAIATRAARRVDKAPGRYPAAIQANGLAPEEPARRTVEVEAFCSWSACRIKILSIALASTGLIGLISHGVLNIMCRKFSA